MAQQIAGRVVRRGQDRYEEDRQALIWDARVPDRHPEEIVHATSVEDVVGAMRLAREEGLKITVRSGGHAWGGNAIRDGVLVIDMSAMAEASIDRDSMTAWADAAFQGAHLNAALHEQDLYFPVGHCTGVCIGGYLLQGGIGWNGKQYGPACMHVTGLDVVTTDGEVRFVDETHEPDLFWASKGSGPGFFAVVTRFHIKVYPRNKVTMNSGYLYPAELFEEVYGFTHEVGKSTPTEINLMYYRDPDIRQDGPIIGLQATAFTDSEDDAREQLSIYDTCPVVDRVVGKNLHEVTDTTVLSSAGTDSHYFKTHRYLADNMWTSASFEKLKPGIEEILSKLPQDPSHMMWMNWGYENGPERPDMPFVEDDFYYAIYGACEDAGDDETIRSWVTDGMRSIEPLATGMGLADENTQNRPPGGSVHVTKDAASFDRLEQIRAAYDPDGIFYAPW